MLHNALKSTRCGSNGTFVHSSCLHTTSALPSSVKRPRTTFGLVTKGSSRTKLGDPLGNSAKRRWSKDDDDGKTARPLEKVFSRPSPGQRKVVQLPSSESHKRQRSAVSANPTTSRFQMDEWEDYSENLQSSDTSFPRPHLGQVTRDTPLDLDGQEDGNDDGEHSPRLENVFARPMNPGQRKAFQDAYPGSSKRPLPAAFTNTPLISPPLVSTSDDDMTSFSSPPLMPALLTSVGEVLGPDAKPTIIQHLALTHLIHPKYSSEDAPLETPAVGWTQTLLASETGSGKTLAYLLPVLHNLKHTERHGPLPPPLRGPARLYMPRALVLSPTHELSRQLASSAKALSHVAKLRVLCTSRANRPNTSGVAVQLRNMQSLGERVDPDADEGEIVITRRVATMLGIGKTVGQAHPIDVATGTPKAILEYVRGHGWDRDGEIFRDERGQEVKRWNVGNCLMNVERIEWVVVDEADILLDPDFRDYTLALLDDIAQARAHLIEPSQPGSLPFHLLLNSATIPGLLNSTIDEHWPRMQRLASPGVHRLPAGMHTQHVRGTGNRMSDVADRIKRIWADDGMKSVEQSKILVFVNKNTRATELSAYLNSKGIANLALTGTSGRAVGSNRHLASFVKPAPGAPPPQDSGVDVLVTTSLLSRGLDFSPRVRHVLFLDEPRNVVDLLHRAGRSARAGNEGTLTIFGGKGSRGAQDIASRVRALEAKSARTLQPQESERTPTRAGSIPRRHSSYHVANNRRPMKHA